MPELTNEPKDAAVSQPPSSEQAHMEKPPDRTPGLGPDHQHRLKARKEDS